MNTVQLHHLTTTTTTADVTTMSTVVMIIQFFQMFSIITNTNYILLSFKPSTMFLCVCVC